MAHAMSLSLLSVQLLQDLFLFGVGACVGSFMNVLIYRVPRGLAPWRPRRSFCPRCGAPIRWYDNVPLISYFLLRGRCRNCRERIGIRYPLVEAAGGILALLSVWRYGWSRTGLEAFLLGALLLTLAVIDLETYRLPDVLVGVGAALALGFGCWDGLAVGAWSPLRARILVGLAGLGGLAAVRWIAGRLAGREAMGRGDVTCFGMLGLFLADPWRLFVALVLAAVMGTVVGGLGWLLTRGRIRIVPFGPFLAAGGWSVFLFGEQLVRAYFSAVGAWTSWLR